jgi:RNA polymerase sigma-70 factor (TIGR02960 family)
MLDKGACNSESEVSRTSLARPRDDAAFQKLVAPHNGKVHAHCYRMLGSPFDADDALQETLIAAWRGLPAFEERSALGTWLYQIATRVCLRMLSGRRRRIVAADLGPAWHSPVNLGQPRHDLRWVEPLPDAMEQNAEDGLMRREHLQLSFVALLQHLPGNQRAVFLLREVLHCSAAETAEAIGTTVASVNSSLQRARRTLSTRSSKVDEHSTLGGDDIRQLVLKFSIAWENGDVPAMIELLSRDVRFTMPPLPAWFEGQHAVARFLAERMFETPWRVLPLAGNGQPGLACYLRQAGDDRFRPGAVALLRVHQEGVTAIDTFQDPALFRRFGVADELF